ncbi:MAG: biotin/lipoyl-containing protein, partial [Pseudomonadota bacterium]
FFSLNGQPRMIRIMNRAVSADARTTQKADADNPYHIGAPMPGVIVSLSVEAGTEVKAGAILLSIEAMKMETSIHAERDAVVKSVRVDVGDQIDAKDLLIELSPDE